MKPIIILFFSALCSFSAIGQTVNSSYLNPTGGNGNPYQYLRFGTPQAYWAGFMWNNNSVSYGNGNDFSIFTYGDRDITLRPGNGNVIVFPEAGGNMGIGTINPTEKLHINGSIKGNIGGGALRVKSDSGYIDVGAQNTSWAHIYTDRPKVIFNKPVYSGANTFSSYSNDLVLQTEGNTRMVINDDTGNVGIGTTTPDAKLAVNGNIHTKEVKVDLIGWSDFVFYKDYKLPTLEEVAQHIKEKGHLKDIPSAKEVAENGILLGEMNAKLLQKIEELTLYMIELKKQNDNQQKEIEQLKKK